MRASEFHEKVRIINGTSKIFNKTMTKNKMMELVNLVFETEGICVDNFEYVVELKISGDLTGYRQGTGEEVVTKIGFILDDRKYILCKSVY